MLDISAPDWCVPCQRLAPHYDKAAEALPEKTFLAIDADKAPWVHETFGVRSVPTVLHFVEGNPVPAPVTGRTVVQLIKELS